MTPDDQWRPILATARELYGRVVYTHKTHEKEREIWAAKACSMSRVNVYLSGATTLFAVISAALKPTWALVLTALFAAVTVGYAVWQGSFDPIGKENQHRVAAKELLWLREQLLLLIVDCHTRVGAALHVQESLEMITRELTAVYKFAPSTSPEAYGLAEKALKAGHFTFTEEEIDMFLPSALRSDRVVADASK